MKPDPFWRLLDIVAVVLMTCVAFVLIGRWAIRQVFGL